MPSPKFQLNPGETATITTKNPPREMDGNYGKYWIVNVDHDGVGKAWFISNQVISQKLGIIGTYKVEKTAPNKEGRSYYNVELQGSPQYYPSDAQKPPQEAATQQGGISARDDLILRQVAFKGAVEVSCSILSKGDHAAVDSIRRDTDTFHKILRGEA